MAKQEMPNLVSRLLIDFEELYETSKFSDLEICVGSEIIRVHKGILAARNYRLAKFFEEEILSGNALKSIKIPNFEPEHVKTFIKYLYTSKINKKDITRELFIIAHKYLDKNLRQICENHFIENMNQNTAIDMLNLGIEYNCENLKKCASKYIAMNFKSIKYQDKFKNILKDQEAAAAVIEGLSNAVIDKRQPPCSYTHQFLLKLSEVKTSWFEIFNTGDVQWKIMFLKQRSSFDSNDWAVLYLKSDCEEKYCCEVNFTIKEFSQLDNFIDEINEVKEKENGEDKIFKSTISKMNSKEEDTSGHDQSEETEIDFKFCSLNTIVSLPSYQNSGNSYNFHLKDNKLSEEIIPWSKLIDPKNRFIEDGLIQIEIGIKLSVL